MKLRDYQLEPVAIGIEFFNTPKMAPSIIVAPTAFGKSIVIAYIAKGINEKVLVIQPSKELLEQNYNKLINLGGKASIYSASMGEKEIGDITYATIGSIINIAWKFRELGITLSNKNEIHFIRPVLVLVIIYQNNHLILMMLYQYILLAIVPYNYYK